MTTVHDLRIHAAQEPSPRTDGELVLYWMQTTQRVQQNFAEKKFDVARYLKRHPPVSP